MPSISYSVALAKLEPNPPIWESSRRPLHPKCVWVESTAGASNGGRRHFIFDYNLTNSYHGRNDTTSFSGHFHPFTLDKAQSFDAMESKMNSLSIIGSSDRMHSGRSFSSLSDRPELEKLALENEMFEPLHLATTEPVIEPIELTKEAAVTPSMKRISSEIDSSKNLLAERVLQWLDLAGGRSSHSSARRSDLMGKFSKGRSLTAKEPRKSIELHEEIGAKTKVRREPVRQLSMTFNEGNVKDLQSPNQTIVSLSFGDLFPTTYKCSRKFLSLRRPKNAADTLEPLDLQTSMPLKSNKKQKNFSIRGKPKRLEYFEDQYRSIIQRQILETSCNAQAAKRQLHIFMPNLPKRALIVNDGDKIAHLMSPKSMADSDSCLSCRFASS